MSLQTQNKKSIKNKLSIMEEKKETLINNKYRIILGVDPGYGRIGIAIIKKTKIGDNLIHSECFETNPKLPHYKRIFDLGERIKNIVEDYKPDELAIETLLWSKNKKTALQVAEARGVIIYQAIIKNLKIKEFNPNQIKLAITGYGKSDKNQIKNMIEKILKINKKDKKIDDEYDAIAIALTCSTTNLSTEKL